MTLAMTLFLFFYTPPVPQFGSGGSVFPGNGINGGFLPTTGLHYSAITSTIFAGITSAQYTTIIQ